MPVFFFSLSQADDIIFYKAALVFFILHFVLYPASNGYNSYMDRDEESIGLLARPPRPTKQLFILTALMDCVAILMSFFVNAMFVACIIANIAASRAYSYRGIRLKKFPVTGFLTVVVFQGAVTYLMVYVGSQPEVDHIPWSGMLVSSLLFGGFYPLTQIYQHEQDMRDGVKTLSYVLGLRGTFIFSGTMYALAEVALFFSFFHDGRLNQFLMLQIFFIPVLWYFIVWWKEVNHNPQNADFRHSMKMNMIAAVCTNGAFVSLFFINHHLF